MFIKLIKFQKPAAASPPLGAQPQSPVQHGSAGASCAKS